MWIKKKEFEDLKRRVEELEEKTVTEDESEPCPKCGIELIETTTFGASKKSKMCPKCGNTKYYDFAELR